MFNISFCCCRQNVSNIFVQLTEGRSARDQPKQPPAKKKQLALWHIWTNRKLRSLPQRCDCNFLASWTATRCLPRLLRTDWVLLLTMVEDDTWHLIEDQPNISSQFGAVPKCKPVPSFVRTLPTSLHTELKKGGKPIPNFGRHHPYSDQPYPRRSEAAPQIARVKPCQTTSSSTPSRPSGPRSSHTVRVPSSTEFSTDLQRRWILFIAQIGALSSFWREFSPCHSFDDLALRLLDKYASSTVTKYLGRYSAKFWNDSFRPATFLARRRDASNCRSSSVHTRRQEVWVWFRGYIPH